MELEERPIRRNRLPDIKIIFNTVGLKFFKIAREMLLYFPVQVCHPVIDRMDHLSHTVFQNTPAGKSFTPSFVQGVKIVTDRFGTSVTAMIKFFQKDMDIRFQKIADLRIFKNFTLPDLQQPALAATHLFLYQRK